MAEETLFKLETGPGSGVAVKVADGFVVLRVAVDGVAHDLGLNKDGAAAVAIALIQAAETISPALSAAGGIH